MFLSNSAQRHDKKIDKYVNVMSINDIFGLIHKEEDYKKLNLINNKISKNIDNLNKLTSLINDIGTKKLPTLKNVTKTLKLIKNNNFNQLNFLDEIKNTFTVKDFKNFQNELSMLVFILKKKDKKLLKNFLKKTKILFKGNSGIGMNYYMFYKNK